MAVIKPLSYASLLLVSSALVSPAAFAQTTDTGADMDAQDPAADDATDPAEQEEQDV